MTEGRFVDYARHGGCSMKLEPARLRRLLQPLRSAGAPGEEWPDAGVGPVGRQRVASSVDVVLPMIDDPRLFGRIVVNHVLSDLYAVGAKPAFALSILGIPQPGKEVSDEDEFNRRVDEEVQKMLVAADQELEKAGVATRGGHTLMDHALFFGMAATGDFGDGLEISNATARAGDSLVLTKPVGTSVATKLWKTETKSKNDFEDVVKGMLRSNLAASQAMLELERCSCTDVTGFGLCGHLHNMVLASGVSATVRVADVPVYQSVTEHRYMGRDTTTRIYAPNRTYLDAYLDVGKVDADLLPLYLDAQVSGGLLLSLPDSDASAFVKGLRDRGEDAWVIGEVGSGKPGSITLQ